MQLYLTLQWTNALDIHIYSSKWKKKSLGSYTTFVIFWVYIFFIGKTSPKYVFAYEFKFMAISEHLKIKKNEE